MEKDCFMGTKESQIENELKRQESSLKTNIGLYETMVIKPQMRSRTPEGIKTMIDFKEGLESEKEHIGYKRNNCLGCEKALTCKSKC